MKRILGTSRLFTKVFVREALLFFLLAAVVAVVSSFSVYTIQIQTSISKGEAIAKAISGALVGSLLEARDPSMVQNYLEQYQEIEGIAYILVLNDFLEPLAHTFVPEVPPDLLHLAESSYSQLDKSESLHYYHLDGHGTFIDISNPVLGGVLGYVHVGLDWQAILATTIRTATLLSLIILAIFAISLWVLYGFARRVSGPLLQLTNFAKQASRRDFSLRINLDRDDELGDLATAMDEMASQLNSSFQKLEDAFAYKRGILDSVASGLVVADRKGYITRCNPAFVEMLQVNNQDSLIGKRCSFILGRQVEELARKSIQSGESFSAEVALPEGRIGKANGRAVQIRENEEDSRIGGVVILLADVTREWEIDQMKTNFISTVSHELRTPLTSIIGFAKIIRRRIGRINKLSEKLEVPKDIRGGIGQVENNVSIIIREGERLAALIDNLLDIVRIESGEVVWAEEKIDLGELIQHVIGTLEPLVEKGKVSLVSDISPDIPIFIGDRDHLLQVILNLGANAVKFTLQGTITFKAEASPGNVKVSVIDTGPGIAQEEQKRLFNRFQQIGDTLTNKPKGTGLGLAICKEIVENHGGEIGVDSKLGEGSCFYFVIPISSTQD